MSRIGNKSVNIEDVETELTESTIIIKGKKGSVEIQLFPELNVDISDNILSVSRKNDLKKSRELHGLLRSLIYNAVHGVTIGYTYNLFLQGIGYRVQKKGKDLEFSLGYSHPVLFKTIEGIEFNVEGQDKFSVSSPYKDLVGQVCSDIKKLPKKDAYKGKGIFFVGEVVRKKPGKTVK